jgi:probable F420-dependent oxidoreductase
MRFGIMPPVRAGVAADPGWMSAFARHVESCGFESVVVVEHAVVVSGYESTYPYARSGRMPLPDDCPIPDPLDLLAFLAAVTDRLVLATGVLVLPNHQPVVLAKRAATVDALSGGRLRLCVGVGWMDEELRATGADPRTRGRRTDESIGAMRTLWAGRGPEGVDFDGEFVSFAHAHSYPKPTAPAGIPVHIGGHSRAAAERAGRLGDGFQPLGLSPDEVGALVGHARRAAEEAGRDPDALELTLSGYLPATDWETVAEAEAVGADRLVLSTSITDDLDAVRDELSSFAELMRLSPAAP